MAAFGVDKLSTEHLKVSQHGNETAHRGDVMADPLENIQPDKKRLSSRFFIFLKKSYVIPPKILFFLTRIPVKIFFKLFYGLKIVGVENIKTLPPGVVFAANHSSEVDSILMTFIFPIFSQHLPLFYAALSKGHYGNCGWRQILYGGLFFKAWGAYPIKNGIHDYGIALANQLQLLRDRRSVCIFPEGRRYYEGKVGKARGGVAYLSYRTGTPIVPVAIIGSCGIKFRDILFFRRKIKLIIGKPIYPQQLFENVEKPEITDDHNDFKIAAEGVMNQVRDLMQRG